MFEAGNKQKHDNLKRLGLEDFNILGGHGTGSPVQNFEFPFVSFKDIVAATDDFNKSHMIGQGGFGKVYKVISPVTDLVLVLFEAYMNFNLIHFSTSIYEGNARWS
jgi:hypothetical protein